MPDRATGETEAAPEVKEATMLDALMPTARSRGLELPTWTHSFLARYALVLIWAVMAGFFWINEPDTFGSMTTISAIFSGKQVQVFLAMSVLVTAVVAELDLSFAAVMGISATIISVLAGVHGWPVWLACVVGLLAAVLCGCVNGFFVVRLGVSSLIVTLGMSTLLLGLAQWFTGNTIVSLVSPGLAKTALYEVLGMPVSFWYGIALALLITYFLGWTPTGRSMIFVGSNPEVARLAGIRVGRVRFGAFVAAALLAGFAGLILVATVGGVSSSTSISLLLPALAAVFLGTAVVRPGTFNPIGTLVAIYFLETGIYGLQLMGLTGWIKDVFYGAGLVIAVTLAKLVHDRTKTA